VVELSRDQIPLFAGVKLSQHQVTFQEVLGLAQMREKLPAHLHFIGVQPVDISVGYGLTPEVERLVPEVAKRVKRVLNEWGEWDELRMKK